MKSVEIRRAFLRYFEGKGHTALPSSPLVPHDDPTLLFTNAGMVQFKRTFLGEEPRPYKRAATAQKCLRAGGKHNDLENVGYTVRHHTFFEMLGNFSFGDYFKEDAISFAWELLNKHFSLPKKDIWITIYKDDEESFGLWRKIADAPTDRIVRRGDEDNFWAMGDVGPCGPCSEVIVDQGPEVGCRRPQCDITCTCDRFLELWNLVFMQFNRDEKGVLSPLPRPSIDTGMGLERTAAVLQGVKSNYETDLFLPIIKKIKTLLPKASEKSGMETSFRAISDHVRAMTFLVAEGILPSNEGRGYVLRRIMRRASRHGKKLGIDGPFLHKISHTIVRLMKEPYPELVHQESFVSETIKTEEERFLETLERGMEIFYQEVSKLKKAGQRGIPGEIAFRLYDTFGFPMDMTRDMAREEGFDLDEAGFQKEMEAQQSRARASRPAATLSTSTGRAEYRTRFTGYNSLVGESTIIGIFMDGKPVDILREGELGELIVEETPFYGESGGQVGDQGKIEGGKSTFVVETCMKPSEEVISHIGRATQGAFKNGDRVRLLVDADRRAATAANHSATHLLHWALRRTLGEHVRQAGSLVTPDRFRFDFTFGKSLKSEEISVIEDMVNARIRENHPVKTEAMAYKDALGKGVIALFGEKYGDIVRAVSIGDFSTELCGGTHTGATGQIGLFTILSDTAIGAGVRRIEALTGKGALEHFKTMMKVLEETSELLGSGKDDLLDRMRKLLDEKKALKKEVERLSRKISGQKPIDVLSSMREIKGVKVLSAEVDDVDLKTLRDMAETMMGRLGSGIVVLGTIRDEKAHLVAFVSKDLTDRFHAGKLLTAAAEIVGGRGGGRGDFAQAGGTRKEGLKDALNKIYTIVETG